MKKILFVALISLTMFACKSDKVAFEKVDLLQYGIPLTINAPVGSEISQPYGEGEVWIKNEAAHYFIQARKLSTLTNDVAKVKTEELEAVKANSGFSKLISEEKNGFIFEENYDKVAYDFRYIIIQGDNQYIFQKILTELSTLEEVQRMYQSLY